MHFIPLIYLIITIMMVKCVLILTDEALLAFLIEYL